MNNANPRQPDDGGDPYAAPGERKYRAAARPAASPAPASAAPAALSPSVLTAKRQKIAGTEFVLYAGEADAPLKVARHLAGFSPLHLILNRHTLSQPLSVEIPAPACLWNWLPKDILLEVSPLLLSGTDEVDLYAVLPETWPQESLVCLLSKQKHAPLLAHLRAVIRGDDGTSTAAPNDVFAMYLPKVLRGLLPHAASPALAPRVAQLMSAIDGLLIPASPPTGWQLYCTPQLDSTLRPSVNILPDDAPV